MSALFLPWLVYSSSSAWSWPIEEWTHTSELGLIDHVFNYDHDIGDVITVYLIVIGSLTILFTFLAVVPMTFGILLFLDSIWQSLGTHSGPDIYYRYSLGLGVYVSLAACVLGAVSAIPRLSPSIKLKENNSKETLTSR